MSHLKLLAALVIIPTLAGLMLYGAWSLEEGDRPTQEVKSEDGVFTVSVEDEPGSTLVIECDEGLFGDANARFRDHLGLDGPPLNLPGGPMLLAKLPDELSTEHGPLARSAIEFIKRHSPEKIILIAHSDCLVYDVAGAWVDRSEFVRFKQYADLGAAAKLISSWLPNIRVEAYYALKDRGEIKFNPVPLTAEKEAR